MPGMPSPIFGTFMLSYIDRLGSDVGVDPVDDDVTDTLFVRLLHLLDMPSRSSVDWFKPDPTLLVGERLRGEVLRGDWLSMAK